MGKNILIVDDAAFMRMMIKDILTKNGYIVVGEAENGAVALDKFQELNPDLVIMDITMPEVDGIADINLQKSINAVLKAKFTELTREFQTDCLVDFQKIFNNYLKEYSGKIIFEVVTDVDDEIKNSKEIIQTIVNQV